MLFYCPDCSFLFHSYEVEHRSSCPLCETAVVVENAFATPWKEFEASITRNAIVNTLWNLAKLFSTPYLFRKEWLLSKTKRTSRWTTWDHLRTAVHSRLAKSIAAICIYFPIFSYALGLLWTPAEWLSAIVGRSADTITTSIILASLAAIPAAIVQILFAYWVPRHFKEYRNLNHFLRRCKQTCETIVTTEGQLITFWEISKYGSPKKRLILGVLLVLSVGLAAVHYFVRVIP